jgi:YHS domain-containing protein
MKWTAMLLGVALMTGAMIGCEKTDSTTLPPAGASQGGAPDASDEPTTAPTTGPVTQASASLTISNKFCAIDTDNKVDPAVTTTYQGKTIGFCCKDCIPTFEKEPAKYMASLK